MFFQEASVYDCLHRYHEIHLVIANEKHFLRYLFIPRIIAKRLNGKMCLRSSSQIFCLAGIYILFNASNDVTKIYKHFLNQCKLSVEVMMKLEFTNKWIDTCSSDSWKITTLRKIIFKAFSKFFTQSAIYLPNKETGGLEF